MTRKHPEGKRGAKGTGLNNGTNKSRGSNVPGKGTIILYQDKKGANQLEVKLEDETVWLNAHQMAQIFGIDRTGIVRHINNVYKGLELNRNSTCAKIAQVARDGRKRVIDYYNLDMIISVGYRVNSRQATHFRIWATQVLKAHLIQGYSLNHKKLLETKSKFQELQTAINFLQKKAQRRLLKGQEKELLNLIADYSKTLTILENYDKEKIKKPKGKQNRFKLTYKNSKKIIQGVKEELIRKKEASELFAREREAKFKAIIGNLYQTFEQKDLYASLEEKAANLLYLMIKDHPFIDGNKRTGAFLFIYFLDKSDYLYQETGEKKINDNALTALALLIAESDPKEKEILIRIVMNLITE